MTSDPNTSWNAEHYLRFAEERTRPSVDLASRIDVRDPRLVVDLGCGPGNSTQVVRGRWPETLVVGIDNSPDMIAAARASFPDQDWMVGDAAHFTAESPVDVIFSNAALQWVPDHRPLVHNLFGQVAEGGALAFQIPSRRYSRITALIAEVADDVAWRGRMGPALGSVIMESPAFYYDALAQSARSLDLWETEYHHVMENPQAIVEWISSTGLRPYLSALESDEERSRFLGMLGVRVESLYERRADGCVLFEFKRLFVIAYK